mmetsp:Transcript_1879/g.3749  ORF Transcript_1879/g.3749 Transcript_1879/m.3749 type:complete len:553 (-) Transcript_1879:27-1685(-)
MSGIAGGTETNFQLGLKDLEREDPKSPGTASRDLYGFVGAGNEGCTKYDTEDRDRRWAVFLRGFSGRWFWFQSLNTRKQKAFRLLVQEGIPVAWRQAIWLALVGGDFSGEDGELAFNEEVLLEIRKDLDRTFPSHEWFGSKAGEDELGEVLKSFAAASPSIGYCQGLNLYAAQFLLFLSVKDSSKMLVHFVNNVMPDCYFDESLEGRLVDNLVLEHIVRDLWPNMHEKFTTLGFELGVGTGSWFSQCFTGAFADMELNFRLFDLMMIFGNSVLFRLALLIMEKEKALIMESESADELYKVFSEITHGIREHDLRKVMKWKAKKNGIVNSISSIIGLKRKPTIESEVKRLRARYTAKIREQNRPVDWMAVHSCIRWNKSISDVAKIITSPAHANCVDTKNGNYPIHIAAQNGHIELVKWLVDNGAEVNVQNGTGQTPLHMSVSYDYGDVTEFLKMNGADGEICNWKGHPAKIGIEGDKDPSDPMFLLESCQTAEQAMMALEALGVKAAEKPGELDKGDIAMMGMQVKKGKKSLPKGLWKRECQAKFIEVMGMI